MCDSFKFTQTIMPVIVCRLISSTPRSMFAAMSLKITSYANRSMLVGLSSNIGVISELVFIVFFFFSISRNFFVEFEIPKKGLILSITVLGIFILFFSIVIFSRSDRPPVGVAKIKAPKFSQLSQNELKKFDELKLWLSVIFLHTFKC